MDIALKPPEGCRVKGKSGNDSIKAASATLIWPPLYIYSRTQPLITWPYTIFVTEPLPDSVNELLFNYLFLSSLFNSWTQPLHTVQYPNPVLNTKPLIAYEAFIIFTQT